MLRSALRIKKKRNEFKSDPWTCDSTCVSCQRRCWDDGFILAEVWALPHVVFEGALGFVAMQSSGVIFRVKAVVWRYPLKTVEWGLAAPWLGQSVTAFKAINALKGVLTSEFAWLEKKEKKKGEKTSGYWWRGVFPSTGTVVIKGRNWMSLSNY